MNGGDEGLVRCETRKMDRTLAKLKNKLLMIMNGDEGNKNINWGLMWLPNEISVLPVNYK